MSLDLRAALLGKAEVETTRLVDFDFRHRARTMRLLAARLGRDPAALIGEIKASDDAAILPVRRPPQAIVDRRADARGGNWCHGDARRR
jgi:hypothetical protein